ncbi:dolichyl-phosphate-mannose--protein mannosyltransferase [Serinibacter salmoneus]|uniref:Polyprenol-phosphate-mannose--protein mannosyltransferase n=1 Tax=Serinibacter salmoneus TaxID=556530 RepID=A0A2A9D293_9MICO|nr:phospholipid carrier-dependent glycosyltransferase [Serinibacter salmoneus]PFG20491.1 dolichyl-phosphate-mannose-protein mannosyltransferase [Serinibacter salmoneus]
MTDQTATAAPDGEVALPDRRDYRAQLRRRLLDPLESSTRVGWVITALITAAAAVIRLVGLNRPERLVFDETYYVKQAYSLLALGYEGIWEEEVDDAFAQGDYSGLTTDGQYVVHPPLGKWLIALGMRALGTDSYVGWRISVALAGVLGVFLVIRIGRRLFGSMLLGASAGILLAVDGMHIVMSRTAILDMLLSTLVLAAFGAILLDRDWSRRRLADHAALELAAHGRLRDPWGPRLGVRWWLVVAGVLLGAACGVKWSGIYAIATFGILSVMWSLAARRTSGARLWVGAGLVRDGVSSFLALVPVAALTYLASWTSWFASTGAYNRSWASEVNAVAEVPQRTWLPDALNSWWEYHLAAWNFHTGLDSEHTYESHPIGWLLQLRPTSFAWQKIPDGEGNPEALREAVLAVGNPVVWWLGAAALIVVVWWAIRHREWRAWAILAGYIAMYLPWFTYSVPFSDRTIFTFYTVAFAPYVALALTFALGVVSTWRPRRRASHSQRAALQVPVDAPQDDAPVALADGSADRGTDPVPSPDWEPTTAAAGQEGGDVLESESARPHLDAPDASFPGLPPARPANGLAERLAGMRLATSRPLIVVVGAAVLVGAFFYPIWVGMPVTEAFWRAHMWVPNIDELGIGWI